MTIFDSFIFFNELDLLELRLNILKDVVDCFVLTESPFTVSGNEKPLYYLENKDRFGKLNDKIVHNITEEIPNDYNSDEYLVKRPYYTNYNDYSSAAQDKIINIPIRFQRAVYNRDASIEGILKAGAKSDDIILTSDADEICNPLILDKINEWFDPNNIYICYQKAFYYKLNILFYDKWKGTRITTLKKLEEYSIDVLRQPKTVEKSYMIENGGWHWSYFGDLEHIRQKIHALEHQEVNTEENQMMLENRVGSLKDPFGRSYLNPTVEKIDSSYPDYILNNLDKYKKFIEI